MPGVCLMWLEVPEIAATSRPGRFVMVRCGVETMLRRPLSVHKVDGGKLALLFTIVGKGTRWLSQRKTGDIVDIFGPLGNGYTIYPDSKNLLLVAGGIGIAPLCFLTQEAERQKQPVRLLLGAPTRNQLYPKHLLPSGIKLVTATEDGTAGNRGMITDLLPDSILEADQVFACGPVSMYQTIANLSQHYPKLKSAQISLEIMMGCGVGVCYGCTIKTKNGLKQVCKDGPVFDLSDLDNINWDELIL